jgi:GTP-binding protein HflX
MDRVTGSKDGNRRQTENGAQRAGVINPRAAQRAIAIGVVDEADEERDQLAELKELLRTAGVATAGDMVQRRDEPDPDRYLGKGKIAALTREI